MLCAIFTSTAPVPTPPVKTSLLVGGVKLLAAYEGKWGMKLRASVDLDVSEAKAVSMGVTKADLFNLTVTDTGSGITEKFLNLTVKDSPRRIDKVLEAESKVVRWDGTWPPSPLPTVSAGIDGASTQEMALAEKEKDSGAKEKELADAQNETPPNPAKVTAATTARNTAKTGKGYRKNSA